MLDYWTYLRSPRTSKPPIRRVPRGGDTQRGGGSNWRRDLAFTIPVRDHTFWSSDDIATALQDLQRFLSEDRVQFDFVPAQQLPAMETYFNFPGQPPAGVGVERVLLFSGGLDSLAGAIESCQSCASGVALVSHRAASKVYSRQAGLAAELKERFAQDVRHIPRLGAPDRGGRRRENAANPHVSSSPHSGLSSLSSFGCSELYIHENGVTSLNPPMDEDVVGTRATSIHPSALADASPGSVFQCCGSGVQGSQSVYLAHERRRDPVNPRRGLRQSHSNIRELLEHVRGQGGTTSLWYVALSVSIGGLRPWQLGAEMMKIPHQAIARTCGST